MRVGRLTLVRPACVRARLHMLSLLLACRFEFLLFVVLGAAGLVAMQVSGLAADVGGR